MSLKFYNELICSFMDGWLEFWMFIQIETKTNRSCLDNKKHTGTCITSPLEKNKLCLLKSIVKIK